MAATRSAGARRINSPSSPPRHHKPLSPLRFPDPSCPDWAAISIGAGRPTPSVSAITKSACVNRENHCLNIVASLRRLRHAEDSSGSKYLTDRHQPHAPSTGLHNRKMENRGVTIPRCTALTCVLRADAKPKRAGELRAYFRRRFVSREFWPGEPSFNGAIRPFTAYFRRCPVGLCLSRRRVPGPGSGALEGPSESRFRDTSIRLPDGSSGTHSRRWRAGAYSI